MGTKILVNIGSGNGLLSDGIKPLPEAELTYHPYDFFEIYSKVMYTKNTQDINPKICTLEITSHFPRGNKLTHWGRVTQICVSKLAIIGSDNGLSPGPRQAIIWTNAGLLLIRPLGTNFNEMLIEILAFSFMTMCLKMSSAKSRPSCLGLDVLTLQMLTSHTYSHQWACQCPCTSPC